MADDFDSFADDRTLIMTGPFTEEELSELVGTLRRIEERRPDRTFMFVLDDESKTSAHNQETLAMLRRINPLRPGYQRIIEIEGPIE